MPLKRQGTERTLGVGAFRNVKGGFICRKNYLYNCLAENKVSKMRTLVQTCELQIPWSFLSVHSSIPCPGSFVLQYEPSDVLGLPGGSINMLFYHQTSSRNLEGAKFSAFMYAEQCSATDPHHEQFTCRKSYSTQLLQHRVISPCINVNGAVKAFLMLFIRWRQVVHPSAHSFLCQHCPGATLRRKWREDTSHPQNLYLRTFSKLFGASKSRGACCNKLVRDCIKCWNKGCLLSLTSSCSWQPLALCGAMPKGEMAVPWSH